MKIKIEDNPPERLRVSFSMTLFGRIWSLCFGSAFTIVGLIFLGSSLPHTEFLHCERSLEYITCTRGQRLGDILTAGEKTLIMAPGCRASIEESEDEGDINYRMVIQGSSGTLYFGKTKGDRAEAERIVQEVDSFLQYGSDDRYEWQEDIWWWWATPFALIAIAVGIFVLGIALCTNVWMFDRLRGEALRTTHCVLPLRSRRWLLQDITGCRREQSKDSDGDTTYNCAIILRSGQTIKMSPASYPMRNTDRLDQTVARINSFLGTTAH